MFDHTFTYTFDHVVKYSVLQNEYLFLEVCAKVCVKVCVKICMKVCVKVCRFACGVLHCIVPCSIVLCCIVPYCIVLHCAVLCCVVFHYTYCAGLCEATRDYSYAKVCVKAWMFTTDRIVVLPNIAQLSL
jgi:hypothetical protein